MGAVCGCCTTKADSSSLPLQNTTRIKFQSFDGDTEYESSQSNLNPEVMPGRLEPTAEDISALVKILTPRQIPIDDSSNPNITITAFSFDEESIPAPIDRSKNKQIVQQRAPPLGLLGLDVKSKQIHQDKIIPASPVDPAALAMLVTNRLSILGQEPVPATQSNPFEIANTTSTSFESLPPLPKSKSLHSDASHDSNRLPTQPLITRHHSSRSNMFSSQRLPDWDESDIDRHESELKKQIEFLKDFSVLKDGDSSSDDDDDNDGTVRENDNSDIGTDDSHTAENDADNINNSIAS